MVLRGTSGGNCIKLSSLWSSHREASRGGAARTTSRYITMHRFWSHPRLQGVYRNIEKEIAKLPVSVGLLCLEIAVSFVFCQPESRLEEALSALCVPSGPLSMQYTPYSELRLWRWLAVNRAVTRSMVIYFNCEESIFWSIGRNCNSVRASLRGLGAGFASVLPLWDSKKITFAPLINGSSMSTK
jgi:hypothetical protein